MPMLTISVIGCHEAAIHPMTFSLKRRILDSTRRISGMTSVSTNRVSD